jgi:hypothetical protein
MVVTHHCHASLLFETKSWYVPQLPLKHLYYSIDTAPSLICLLLTVELAPIGVIKYLHGQGTGDTHW